MLLFVIAIVAARIVLCVRNLQFSELSPRLIGLWTYEVTPSCTINTWNSNKNRVIFGTGRDRRVKFTRVGYQCRKGLGEIGHYTVYYRDIAGTRHMVDVFLDEPGEVLRFTDNAEARWTRFDLSE